MGQLILRFLCLLTLLYVAHCQLRPDIVDEIIPEVTSQGSSARINCTVVNKQSGHIVTWNFLDSRTGGDIISRDQNIFISNPICKDGLRKYEVLKREVNQRTTYTLIINCLLPVDTGRYKCYIEISGAPSYSYPSKIGYLTVQVPPTITSKNDAVLELDEYNSANLLCEATGIPLPNITWTRADGFPLPTGVALFRGSNLKLLNVSKDYRGAYRCVADNNVRPPDEFLVSVQVFVAPECEAVQDTVGQANTGQYYVRLECKVSGYPEPELTWFRENTAIGQVGREQLNDNDKYDISKQIATSTLRFGWSWYTLRIKNIQANDYTRYFCRASNRLGSAEASIDLFETSECQGGNCPTIGDASSTQVSLLALIFMAVISRLLL
ncbi:hypothetical protein ACJMK2_024777 [Sinanodonta woodiana]|uniref:Ig-like domain-containing protein n=1 Tax=Sinanodonta woodiana TaxID=1069815 RepID=A0ABD3XEF2_SINWO